MLTSQISTSDAASLWPGFPPDIKSEPHSVDLQSIEDAIRLLNKAATNVASGSTSVWRLVDHARRHLEKQIDAVIRQMGHDIVPAERRFPAGEFMCSLRQPCL